MRYAIVVCAGNSTRFGSDKMNASIGDKTVIATSVSKFENICDKTILVVPKDKTDFYRKQFPLCVVVEGGSTRSRSVRNGIEAIPSSDVMQDTLVAVHDGARPFVSAGLINKLFDTAQSVGSAVPFVKATDTVFCNLQPLDRNAVKLVQTPQVFNLRLLKELLEKDNGDYTDESSLWSKYLQLCFVEGERSNVKVTYKEDLLNYTVGYGYDIHRFAKDRKLILCGVEIPFALGLDGHSDADVAVHALMDAILSAVGEKDIGHFFPDTDDKYLGISSMKLLETVMQKVNSRNCSVVSASLAIVCEKPRLAPYLDQMKANLVNSLCGGCQVSISVTTAEGVGEIGQGTAIAARASVLVRNQGE